MKTLLFKVLSAFFAVSILTSCLGGGDSYLENSRDFAYVKNIRVSEYESVKCAVTEAAGAIRSDKVDALTEGRAYYVSYKVTPTSNYYAVAEKFDLVQNDPIPQAISELGAPYSKIPTIQVGDSIHPKSLNIGTFHPYETVIDDNWLIKYSVNKKEDDRIQAYFYFDPDGQKESGKELEANQAIIDVRFINVDKSTESGNTKDEPLEALGSLSQFRKAYQSSVTYESGLEYADVLIKFRYVRYPDNAGEDPKLSTIGTFQSIGSQTLYYMRFFKEN